MAELVISTPEGTVFRYRLGRQASIGRHPDCEILVSDPMASRHHCRIEQAASGAYFVEDAGSANGTLLNGEFLRTRMPLRPNDVVQIGATRLVLQPTTVTVPAGQLAPVRPRAEADPNVSIVRQREDLEEGTVSFDYATSADVQAVTDDEAASSDLRQLKKVTQRLRVLLDLGQSLGSSLLPRKLLQSCLDKLFEVFPQAERGFILLLDPEGELPSAIVARHEGDDALEEHTGPLSVSKIRNPQPGEENEVRVSWTVVNRVRSQRQSVLINDIGDASASPAVSMVRLEIHSVMCAPLIAGGVALGLIYLDTKDATRRFGPDDVNLLTAVAGQIAVVIRNAALARQAAADAARSQNLQRYLSPHLVERIMKNELTIEPGGQLKHGTVFFSDLISFTRMAAQMAPPDVVTLLNRYFRVMQEIIFDRGGTVDKFGGDQIMAFWGVLVDTPHAAAAAVAAALEMQNAMFIFNRDLAYAKDIVKPASPLGHGIGLNTGEFIAGNIGSERKIEFTVIGNAVNLAQRVESICGRGQVFIGQGTYDAIRERCLVIRLPDCPVKGVDVPLPVYSLRGLMPPSKPQQTITTVDTIGETSRLDTGAADMLYSLPCTLEAEGHPPIAGVATKIAFSRAERRGRIQLLVEVPLAVGTRARLCWNLPEKRSLAPLPGQVEHSWSAGPVDGKPGSSHLTTTEAVLGTMVLRVADLPPDLLGFRVGLQLPSDLTSHEQIVRA